MLHASPLLVSAKTLLRGTPRGADEVQSPQYLREDSLQNHRMIKCAKANLTEKTFKFVQIVDGALRNASLKSTLRQGVNAFLASISASTYREAAGSCSHPRVTWLHLVIIGCSGGYGQFAFCKGAL